MKWTPTLLAFYYQGLTEGLTTVYVVVICTAQRVGGRDGARSDAAAAVGRGGDLNESRGAAAEALLCPAVLWRGAGRMQPKTLL